MNATILMTNMFFAAVLGIAVWQVLSIYKRRLAEKQERQHMVERARQRSEKSVGRLEQSFEDEILQAEMAVRTNRWHENNASEFRFEPKQKGVKR